MSTDACGITGEGIQSLEKSWAEKRAWHTLSAHELPICQYSSMSANFAKLIEFHSRSPLSVLFVTSSHTDLMLMDEQKQSI